MARVELVNVRKSFGAVEVIRGVDLDIAQGEFIVLVGPSGCGKSTMLRLISGLEDTTGGTIRIGGRDVTRVAPSKRELAMVFQSYALFPHLTVAENIGFGLSLARTPKAETERRVREVARTLRIDELLERMPRQLSGGQRQRVAIGRSIIRNPKVFLFDEPLSNLDAALRVQMRLEIAKLHKHLGGVTMIYVTHDQTEAMTLADRIAVINDGMIEQVGTPMELYRRPANAFVAGFIGAPSMNFVEGEVTDRGEIAFGGITIRPAGEVSHRGRATIGFRPEHVAVATAEQADFEAHLDLVEQLGAETLLHFDTSFCDTSLTVRLDAEASMREGDTVPLAIDRKQIHVFPE